MNSIQIREQIISFLLQQIDGNARVIEELQKQIAERDKKIAGYEGDKPSKAAKA